MTLCVTEVIKKLIFDTHRIFEAIIIKAKEVSLAQAFKRLYTKKRKTQTVNYYCLNT